MAHNMPKNVGPSRQEHISTSINNNNTDNHDNNNNDGEDDENEVNSDLSDEEQGMKLEPKALEVIYGALQSPDSSPPHAHKPLTNSTDFSNTGMRLPSTSNMSSSSSVQPQDMSIRVPTINTTISHHRGQGDSGAPGEPEPKRQRLVYHDPAVTIATKYNIPLTVAAAAGSTQHHKTNQHLQSTLNATTVQNVMTSLASLSDTHVVAYPAAVTTQHPHHSGLTAAAATNNLSSFNTLAALASSMTNLGNTQPAQAAVATATSAPSTNGGVLPNLLRNNCDGCQVKEQLITELLGMLRAKQLELETLRKMYAELLPTPEITAYMRRLLTLVQVTHGTQSSPPPHGNTTPPLPPSTPSSSAAAATSSTPHATPTTVIKQSAVQPYQVQVQIPISPLTISVPTTPSESTDPHLALQIETTPITSSSSSSATDIGGKVIKSEKVRLHSEYDIHLPRNELENSLRKGKGSATAVLRYLMDIFYDNLTLAESSLTGEGKIKKKLDPLIMSAIKAFVRENFPDVRESLLNAAATDKCVQARRLLLRKQHSQGHSTTQQTGSSSSSAAHAVAGARVVPKELVNVPGYSVQHMSILKLMNNSSSGGSGGGGGAGGDELKNNQ
ncbi:uncharacterized protein LOC141911614 [Tubulanus polymorphus]|uniref:uncharacterized protein LOC141911614 n=1 Tax=Tubulanus polymorphus TaxID=672921 RepID=UPI003DA3AB1D